MPFAILQRDLTPPTLDQLKRAFRATNFLTEVDAHTLGSDAFGILVNNLTPENASMLQGTLQREGVATDIVDQRELPQLPATKFLQRVDCEPEALVLYDPLGRAFRLDWAHIMLLAAGSVRVVDFKRVTKSSYVTRVDWQGAPHMEEVKEVSTKEEMNYRLLLEIVLTRAVGRYSVTAENFNFIGLGGRRTRNLPENFTLLVRELMKFAPNAMVNRGAACLREGSTETISYPSKNAFFEEIIWLLWKMRQSAAS